MVGAVYSISSDREHKLKGIEGMNIDLDELLHGNPTWPEVVAFWKSQGFDDESYLVRAIEKHLLTSTQCLLMLKHNLTIEKMLNGQFGMEESIVDGIFDEWNAKLGYRAFGF